MNRIKQISLILVSVTIGCTDLASGSKEKVSTSNPNVILIMADDLGWGDVGYNGQTKIKTPTIDMLAKEGMIFNRMYAGSAVCGPSRASLITGLHTGHGEVRGNPKWSISGNPVDFNPEHITLGDILKKAGYRTGIIGKWGLAENLAETVPNKQGFDYFYGFNRHRPAHHYYPEEIWENDSLIALEQNDTELKIGDHVQELFTAKALDFISTKGEKPFFLYLAYTTPHYELTLPDQYKIQYDTLGWPLREMKPAHYYHDKNGHVTYASMVSKMDQDISRLIARLKSIGKYDNSLIIFTSDNGHEYDRLNDEFFNSNGPYKGKKRDLYDGGLHMPFIAHWPAQIKGGQSTDHLAAFWDVKATLGELVDVELLEPTDGVSFLPTLTGQENQPEHDHLYWEFNEKQGPIQAIVKDHWKLIRTVENNEFELYNLQTNPGETQNVKDQFSDVFESMKASLITERTSHDQFPLTRRPDPWKK